MNRANGRSADPAPPTEQPQLSDRWPWQRSLQARMIVAYGGAFLIILAALTFWLARTVYNTYLESAEHDLEVAAFLAANALEDPLSGYADEFAQYQRWEIEHQQADDNEEGADSTSDGDDEDGDGDDGEENNAGKRTPTALARPTQLPPATAPPPPAAQLVLPRLQSVAEVYANDSGARVTILEKNGRPLADSQHPVQQIAAQGDRPEVRAALAGVEMADIRPDDFSGAPTLFAAAPIQQGSEILGIVQMSKPMQVVTAPAQRLLSTIVAAGIVAVLVSIALSVWISRQLVRPVLRLEEAAMATAQGDLTQQVPVQTSDELGALARAFNYMVRELRTMLDQQRAFVANASHELRSPLTNIVLRIEAIRSLGEEEADISERYLEEIELEADRLTRLANALLDLSHLESDRSPLPLEATDLAPLLQNVAAIMQLRARTVGISLEAALPAALPAVAIHPEQIEEAILNLLDNAIKYTAPGGMVNLSAAVEGRTLRVTVADTGAGIPSEDLPHIFDRFYRVDKARSRAKGGQSGMGSGAGLGLSIVKQIVEQNHAEIQVESAPGKGTTFVVSFPLMDNRAYE